MSTERKYVERTIVALVIGREYIEEVFDNMKLAYNFLNDLDGRDGISLESFDFGEGGIKGTQDFGFGGIDAKVTIRGNMTNSADGLPDVEIPEYRLSQFNPTAPHEGMVVIFPTEGMRIDVRPNRAFVEAEAHGHDYLETYMLLRAAYQIYRTME